MSQSVSLSLFSILKSHTTKEEMEWLDSIPKMHLESVMTAFVKAPRHLSKTIIQTPIGIGDLIPEVPGFTVQDWNLVRLSRVWLLSFFAQLPKEQLVQKIETLFDTAELNELVALFSALPILPYPDVWLPRATDAVRSNMGFVFDSIALCNPYPFFHFPELAWNQLVLKTIFNSKPIALIYGISQRKNKNLSESIFDFIRERWAAGRDIPSNVWLLVSPYISDTHLPFLKRLFLSQKEEDVMAASLLCSESILEPIQDLFNEHPKYKDEIQKGKWNWSNFMTVC